MKSLRIAVLGARGHWGQNMLAALSLEPQLWERVFALDEEQFDGEQVAFGDHDLTIQDSDEFTFEHAAVVLAAPDSNWQRYRDDIRVAGALLVREAQGEGEVACWPEQFAQRPEVGEWLLPSGTALMIAKVLATLAEAKPLALQATVLHAVANEGQQALETLANQSTALFGQRELELDVYPERIAFNVLPGFGEVNAAGQSNEEAELEGQLAKYSAWNAEQVLCRIARVPVFFGSAVALDVKLDNTPAAEKLAVQLGNIAEIVPGSGAGLMEMAGRAELQISRVRLQNGQVSLWLNADPARLLAQECIQLLSKISHIGYLS